MSLVSYGILPGRLASADNPWLAGNQQGRATHITIPTEDGVQLDGATIRPTTPSDKWVVVFGGNNYRYENWLNDLSDFAKNYNVNVITVNYRGVGSSGGSPSCFEDLNRDGRAVVDYLKKQGIRDENITIEGHSLGGGVALQTGRHFGLRTAVNNTFSSIRAAAPGLIKFTGQISGELYRNFLFRPLQLEETNQKKMAAYQVQPVNDKVPTRRVAQFAAEAPRLEKLSAKERVLYFVKDFIGTWFELAFRVTYFALACLYHLGKGEFKLAAYDVLEILKTTVLCTLICLASPSPTFSAKLHKLMIAKDGTVIQQILTSPNTLSLADKLLKWTGWDVNSRAAWDAIPADKRLAFFAPGDPIIAAEAALVNGSEGIALSDSDHNRLARQDNDRGIRRRYQEFIGTQPTEHQHSEISILQDDGRTHLSHLSEEDDSNEEMGMLDFLAEVNHNSGPHDRSSPTRISPPSTPNSASHA